MKSIKEVAHLLELHSGPKHSNLHELLKSEIKGAGTLMSARTLYFRLVNIALDSKDGQRWIIKPKSGLSRPESIREWMEEDIESSDLLDFCSASTIRNVMKSFISIGLIHIDRYNRMHIGFPINGKILSLNYAAVALKSSFKKQPLDKQDKNEVSSSPVVDEKDTPFWEDV